MNTANEILTIIPFYGGEFKNHSAPENRLNYLIKTIDSVNKITSDIIVGVQNEGDANRIHEVLPRLEIRRIESDNPLYLPANLCKEIQNGQIKHKYILYTEADQIIHFANIGFILSKLDNNIYCVPQRLEETYKLYGYHRGHLVKINKHRFIVANLDYKKNMVEHDSHFYRCLTRSNSYGGCFLCSRGLFKRIKFREADSFYTEHTSGFDIFETDNSVCLKTKKIHDFYVEHLSAIEYHKKIAVQISKNPYPPQFKYWLGLALRLLFGKLYY
jgi:hypothetical protein